MVFYRSLLIFLCLAFISNVEAQTVVADVNGVNILNTTEHVYRVGLLVEQSDGTVDLLVGHVISGHQKLLESYEETVGKITRILWAGELEEENGLITNANETAGIIKEEAFTPYTKGLDIPGTGIDNFKRYIQSHNWLFEKYFNETNYIKYNKDREHLDEHLKDISILRHKLGLDLSILGYRELMESPDVTPTEFASYQLIVTSGSSAILGYYNNVIKLFPELDIPEWRAFEIRLTDFLSAHSYYRAEEFSRTGRAFLDKVMELSNSQVYMVNTIVNHLTAETNKEMKSRLRGGLEAGQNLSDIVRENQGLGFFSDKNIMPLLDEAKKANTKDEETVLLEQVSGLMEAKEHNALTVGDELKDKYKEIKNYIDSGEKDRLFFNNRLKRNFDLSVDQLDILMQDLIKKDGVLEKGTDTKIFFGTEGRNFQDGLYAQIQRLNNNKLNNDFFLLSLMVLVNNHNVIVSGEEANVTSHMIKLMREHRDLFDKLDLFVSKDGWEKKSSLELSEVLQKMDYVRLRIERTRLDVKY